MTSSVYQATIEELESILSPRVVSRSLQEGLKTVGKSPQTVVFEDMEKILKSQVYRQLQVAMPVTEAKNCIADILDKLKVLEAEEARKTEAGRALEQQASSLTFLKDRLKPFNLFFEWPEVQKLRALIQLLEAEHEAGREANKLINDARDQLNAVEQKLEDLLVKQAQDITDLERAFELVKSLGGPKVRRFENLINQITEAQRTRQLAQAELERATKLSFDLRKLMESSIVVEQAAPPPDEVVLLSDDGSDAEAAPPQVETSEEQVEQPDRDELAAKLLELDLANEERELAALEENYRSLFEYTPDFIQNFQVLREELAHKRNISADIEPLREQLEAKQLELKVQLQQEMQAIHQNMDSYEVVNEDLSQQLHITMGVLEMALPPQRDIEHLKRLAAAAQKQHEEQLLAEQEEKARRSEQAGEQKNALKQAVASLKHYQADEELLEQRNILKSWFDILKESHEQREINLDAIKAVKQAVTELEQAAANRSAASELERQKAELRSLQAKLKELPVLSDMSFAATELNAEIHQALSHENAIEENKLQALSQGLNDYRYNLTNAFLQRLDQLSAEAAQFSDELLNIQLIEAKGLLPNSFPNLEGIEKLLNHAREARRNEQINDLHNLETELINYPKAPSELLEPLKAFVDIAQLQLSEGKFVQDFDQAWSLLDAIKQENIRRTSSFEPRLQKALVRFEAVAKLNTEDAIATGRTLAHLDAQKDTLERISTAMQQELESLLEQAENSIEDLERQLDATRAIAGQLMGGSIFDNLFGGPSDTQTDVSSGDFDLLLGAEEDSFLRTHIEPLDNWLEQYRTEAGVESLLVFESGNMVAGYSSLNTTNLTAALSQIDMHFRGLGNELNLGNYQLAIIEMVMHSVITVWITEQHQLIIISDQPTMLNALVHKLRDDLPSLTQWLQQTAIS